MVMGYPGEGLNFTPIWFNGNYSDEAPYDKIKQPLYMIVILSIIFGASFIMSILGNSLVILVVYRNPTMKNVTNYFIVNMTIADILVAIICIPMTLLDNIFAGWPFGSLLCKTTPYITHVSVSASVTTLAAIAFDRYMAICRSWKMKSSKMASIIALVFIWVFSLLVQLPVFIYSEEFPTDTVVPMCGTNWPDYNLQRGYFVVALFLFCYAIPLVIILFCYLLIAIRVWTRNAPGLSANSSCVIQKSKIKVVKMFAIIVSLFACSWLPMYIMRFVFYFNSPISEENVNTLSNYVIPFLQWLSLSNSAINPIIYCMFSKKFRRGFRTLLWCRRKNFWRGRKHRSTMSKYLSNDNSGSGGTFNSEEHHRLHRHYSPAKFMSVEYANGHMTVSFRKDEDDTSTSCS